MAELIDCRGLACPEPVVQTRKAMDAGAASLEVLVDNETARENVSRFASSRGCDVEVKAEAGVFRVTISGCHKASGPSLEEASGKEQTRNLIIISNDVIGNEDSLGRILMRSFLSTLNESEVIPWRLILMNRGVLLSLQEADTRESISSLEDAGVDILVCGTCLDYFDAKSRLGAGRVSNMYEITETMLMATNTVTL